jgi:isopentenyl diphosphate isomerase/L-lactate dehydrogenase-like FMN-dependent dehydrogenase
MESLLERLEDLEDDLIGRAFLYDAPSSYRDGVEAAFEAVRALLARAAAAA